MKQFLRSRQKSIVVALAVLTVLGGMVGSSSGRARNYRRSNRTIYIRGRHRVYALLEPTGMSKSMDQMKAEANMGRKRFAGVFKKGPDQMQSLLEYMTPVKDQGHRGTCVAFASVALLESEIKKEQGGNPNLSEQYAYWASKAVEQVNPNADGSDARGMLETLNQDGTVEQQVWPYELEPWFGERSHPDCVRAYKENPDNIPTECVTNGNPPTEAKEAQKFRVPTVRRIETSPESIVGALEKGHPVVVGIDVYKRAWGFDSPDTSPAFATGDVGMPTQGDVPIGGHAILVIGYDLKNQRYLFKNSWGHQRDGEWGTQPDSQHPHPLGYGTIPFNYVRKFGEAVAAPIKDARVEQRFPVVAGEDTLF